MRIPIITLLFSGKKQLVLKIENVIYVYTCLVCYEIVSFRQRMYVCVLGKRFQFLDQILERKEILICLTMYNRITQISQCEYFRSVYFKTLEKITTKNTKM